MSDTIDIQVVDTGLQAKINALLKAGQSAAMFRTIGSVVANRVRLCFTLGIDPWNSPWAALKIRKGQPLVDTGRLRSSITSKADNSGVTIGTNVKSARVHQFGALIVPKKPGGRLVFPGANGQLIFSKGVKIPARPFMPIRKFGAPVALPPAWSVAVVRALRTYFHKAVEG
jgi:phage gpG-like protein